MSSLDSNNFIIKLNNTELYALSGTYKGYNSLYRKCFPFLVYLYMYFCKCSSTNLLMYGK